MTLRTPRRRISPRAKRRYRAIKDFLRRALGSSSQPDIKINSSIAINVSDIKHKIVGLEQQLTEVNKHCAELVCLESSSRKASQTRVSAPDGIDLPSLKDNTESATQKELQGNETKLLYKKSESHYRKSDDSDSVGKVYHDSKRKDMTMRPLDDMTPQGYKEIKIKKRSKLDSRVNAPLDGSPPYLRKHKARSTYDNFASSYGAATSYHSLHDPRTGRRRNTNYPGRCYEEYVKQHDYVQSTAKAVRAKRHATRNSPETVQELYESKHRRKNKRGPTREVNEDFIADIIKRQYRPMRMFGKRESDVSQFSVPVCRDQEYPIRENIIEGSELCSCCFNDHRKYKYACEYDVSEMRSLCDARMYSTKRPTRHRYHRKHADYYNDSEQYDLVPVKEKASPKMRRKFVDDASIPYKYKEVPPSPRSHRPRLNLRAQYYTEFEDYMLQKKFRNASPKKNRKHYDISENCENDESSLDTTSVNKEKRKTQIVKKIQNENRVQQNVGTTSSLQSPLYINEPVNITQESALNKTQETDASTDKTDKALSEIKDILQSFLQEIKKETTSQCDNSEINAKVGDKCLNEFHPDSAKLSSSVMPNNGHSVNNYTLPQCGLPTNFMPGFPNPCCYPILPICPMNCMPNGYMMPTPSFTCASCANNVKDDAYHKNTGTSNESNNKGNSETEQLIKEIYKFVAQSPLSSRKQERDFLEKTKTESAKDRNRGKMTSRSVGGSSKLSRHDAQVMTHKIRCHSKSCEAIGSRYLSDSYSRTNPSYSDTVLERLSLEAATGSDSELSSDSTATKKRKHNKFAKVLRSFGLFKKKKDVIEELSESESTVEVDVKTKKPPFRQEVMNYVIHDQEYYHRPHSPHQQHAGHYEPPPGYHGYGCHAGCPDHLNHVNPMQAQYHQCPSPKMDRHHLPPKMAAGYRSPLGPSAPPYPYEGHHSQQQPQVPLCLKEVEVKSIGTQSERKMTLFRKFTKKVQGPSHPVPQARRVDELQNCSTQTQQRAPQKQPLFSWKTQLAKNNQKPVQLGKDKPALWSWKTLQAKLNQLDNPDEEGMQYTLNQHKKLAQGDMKMRNAMLNKLFYKRNPFSPRNLIVRTILGKDKSSYGEPPMMVRPRMFY